MASSLSRAPIACRCRIAAPRSECTPGILHPHAHTWARAAVAGAVVARQDVLPCARARCRTPTRCPRAQQPGFARVSGRVPAVAGRRTLRRPRCTRAAASQLRIAGALALLQPEGESRAAPPAVCAGAERRRDRRDEHIRCAVSRSNPNLAGFACDDSPRATALQCTQAGLPLTRLSPAPRPWAAWATEALRAEREASAQRQKRSRTRTATEGATPGPLTLTLPDPQPHPLPHPHPNPNPDPDPNPNRNPNNGRRHAHALCALPRLRRARGDPSPHLVRPSPAC